ncbi:magnesium and cobalt transport protein CorA, partial [Aquipuribacter hungaricus]
ATAHAVDRPHAAPRPDAGPTDAERAVGDCAVYTPDGRVEGRLPLHGAVASAEQRGGFVWVGVQQPSAEEFAEIAAVFGLPELAVEDAVKAHQRPKLEVYGDVLFAVLKPIRYVDSEEVVETAEIAVFVGRTFVVTVRHGVSDVLAGVRRDLDQAGQGHDLLAHGPAGVLYAAADRVVDAYDEVADAIDIDIEQIEGQVFGGDEEDHAQRIYKLKREVLEFRRAVAPLERPLQRLTETDVPHVPAALRPFFRDVHDHAERAAERVEGHDRLLTDVLSADLAQVSVRQNRTAVRQNEDMRKISAWAAIALVPTAVAGIYGMNFQYMPELGWRFGYPAVLLLILVVCLGLARLFRRNGWL